VLVEAFRKGDGAQAWQRVCQLLELTRRLEHEAAQARFKANFGTTMCDACEGLKAGRGVAATCFQVKRCYYTNIKTTDMSSKQRAVIEGLLRPRKI